MGWWMWWCEQLLLLKFYRMWYQLNFRLPPLAAKMAFGKRGAINAFCNLLRNWKSGETGQLQLTCENQHLKLNYSLDLGECTSPACYPWVCRQGPPGPRRGVGPCRQRRRERRAAARAAAYQGNTTEEVVNPSEPVEKTAIAENAKPAEEVVKAFKYIDAAISINITGPEKSTAAEKVPVSEEDAALTPNSYIQNEKFKCDQCTYPNSSEKGLSQHIRMKHCPSLDLRCSRKQHVDLCCDVMVVRSRNKGARVRAPPKVYHANMKMYGTYCEERSDTNSSFYAFPLPLPGRADRIKYLECFVL